MRSPATGALAEYSPWLVSLRATELTALDLAGIVHATLVASTKVSVCGADVRFVENSMDAMGAPGRCVREALMYRIGGGK